MKNITIKSPIHILNGDQLAGQLQEAFFFEAHLIFREALIVGPVLATSLDEFWKIRSGFICESYGVSKEAYFQQTVSEFERLYSLPKNTEVCLWFEDDLFCQINLWFLVSVLSEIPYLQLFRIFPPSSISRWTGFGQTTLAFLKKCYKDRIPFSQQDIHLGKDLWNVYLNQDWEKLKSLSTLSSPCFHFLEEVCQAQLDRLPGVKGMGKPERILKEILASGMDDFQLVFQEFNQQAGIYGFGDLQLKEMVKSLNS